MQASFIITQARREVVEAVGSFWSDSEILDLINKAERDFINKTRLSEDSAQITTVAGQRNYPLPANWLSSRALFVNDEQDGKDSWRRLIPTNLEKISQENPNFLSSETEAQGLPFRYWIWGRELFLDRAPDDAYDIKMFYKSKPITLTASTQSLNTDDSLADAIQAYVLWKMWLKEKEFDLAAAAKDEYLQFVAEGRRFVKKQSGDQKFRMDIESGTPYSGPGGNVGRFDPLL